MNVLKSAYDGARAMAKHVRNGRAQSSEPERSGSEITLFVSADQPSNDDSLAEAKVRELDPNAKIVRLYADAGMSTPRLHTRDGFYNGLRAIEEYVEEEGRAHLQSA